MTYEDLWTAIEKFATAQGLTCSGLAKKCGLDPTAFSKCKRTYKYGQPRWLSFETIAKVLHGTNSTIYDFIKFLPTETNQT